MLKGETLVSKPAHFRSNGTLGDYARVNQEAFKDWMKKLESTKDNAPLEWIRNMILINPALKKHLCNAARARDVKTLKRWLRRATRLRNRCLRTYAIHHAAANGNEEIVDILICFGCNLELKLNGHAPLSTAVWNSRKGITELLARTKIAIDAQDPGKLNAPLHLAAQNSFYAGIRALLKAGASVDIRNQI